ncbi:MAG: copper resistance protein CopC, partial [Candidatus Promineifilaceae bacterium]
MKRFVAVSLGLLIGLAIWVAPSQAHAVLVRSSPAANSSLADPPTAIEIWFSEPLEETYTDLRVVNAAGDDVGAGNSIVDASNVTHLSLALDSLEPGIYTVIWQTLSQVDGHVWSGYFPFTVLNEDGSSPPGGAVGSISSRGELPTPVEAAIRWLTLVGGMLLLGVALFRWLVAPPSKDGNDQDVDADTPALWLLYLAFFLLFVGDWAQIWQQVIRLGDAGQLFDLLLGTRVARLVLARQLLTSTTLLVLLTLPQPRPLRNRERPAFFGIAVYSAGLILLLWLGREQGSSSLIILVFLAVGLAMSVVGWLSRPGEKQGVSYAWIGAVISAVAALFTLALSSHAGGVPGSNW